MRTTKVHLADLDLSKLKFAKGKTNQHGTTTFKMLYDNLPLEILLQPMKAPFGLNTRFSRPTLSLSLDDGAQDVINLENHIKQKMRKHPDFFNVKPELVDEQWNSRVKTSKENKYPPTIKLDVLTPSDNLNYYDPIFMYDKQEHETWNIEKNALCMSSILLQQIAIGSFGISARPIVIFLKNFGADARKEFITYEDAEELISESEQCELDEETNLLKLVPQKA